MKYYRLSILSILSFIVKGPGSSCKSSYNLASEIPKHYFCCNFLVTSKSVRSAQIKEEGGVRFHLLVSGQFAHMRAEIIDINYILQTTTSR